MVHEMSRNGRDSKLGIRLRIIEVIILYVLVCTISLFCIRGFVQEGVVRMTHCGESTTREDLRDGLGDGRFLCDAKYSHE